jgi:hypothetical protein
LSTPFLLRFVRSNDYRSAIIFARLSGIFTILSLALRFNLFAQIRFPIFDRSSSQVLRFLGSHSTFRKRDFGRYCPSLKSGHLASLGWVVPDLRISKSTTF